MAAIAAIILSIWAVLVGTAWGGLSRRALGRVLTAIYAALAFTCVLVLGPGWKASFGAAGILFPYAVAMACVFVL